MPPSFQESGSTIERLDAITNEVDELSQSILGTISSDDDEVIDWTALVNRGMDEAILKEVVPLFISDKKKQLERLAEAVEAGNAKEIRLRTHAIKGGSGNIGAMRLSKASLELEQKASDGDLSNAGELLERMRAEFSKVESFVSSPDWTETAATTSGAFLRTH